MFKKMSIKLKLALISAISTIIIALITNGFGLINKKESVESKSANSVYNIKQDTGSIELKKNQNQYNNDVKGDNNIIVNGDKTETINVHNETKK